MKYFLLLLLALLVLAGCGSPSTRGGIDVRTGIAALQCPNLGSGRGVAAEFIEIRSAGGVLQLAEDEVHAPKVKFANYLEQPVSVILNVKADTDRVAGLDELQTYERDIPVAPAEYTESPDGQRNFEVGCRLGTGESSATQSRELELGTYRYRLQRASDGALSSPQGERFSLTGTLKYAVDQTVAIPWCLFNPSVQAADSRCPTTLVLSGSQLGRINDHLPVYIETFQRDIETQGNEVKLTLLFTLRNGGLGGGASRGYVDDQGLVSFSVEPGFECVSSAGQSMKGSSVQVLLVQGVGSVRCTGLWGGTQWEEGFLNVGLSYPYVYEFRSLPIQLLPPEKNEFRSSSPFLAR